MALSGDIETKRPTGPLSNVDLPDELEFSAASNQGGLKRKLPVTVTNDKGEENKPHCPEP
ncbi:uncharacterized protein QC761_0015580 [Podospora bellae-mahoneyi]|uniref:Uncharacterized protein n=1 Tax=Podospora bellae-mahoneyi TaxID=2093777 RepID=A0ABR0FZI3_9PEZI|nr:hypothetical protein QC761_0015580 [Podospora bellae-mahoneyi]